MGLVLWVAYMICGSSAYSIDRVGIVEDEAIQAIRGDELAKTEKEKSGLQSAMQQLEIRCSELREQLNKRQKMDQILDALFEDDETKDIVIKRIRAAEQDGIFRT
jgi:hypothetical protein